MGKSQKKTNPLSSDGVATLRNYKKGDSIFHEGDRGDCGYIVQSGRVEIFLVRGGNKESLATLAEGEIFGEMAIIDESLRSASAECVEDCTLSVVSKSQLRDRVNGADPIVRMLLKVLIQRLRNELGSLGTTLDELNEKASQLINDAMELEARQEEKNRKEAVEKIKTEAELGSALRNDQFQLHYQPIVSLDDGQIAGFEALIRWIHPTLGQIRPDLFIGLAEETNLIIPIGRWVLQKAIQDLKALQMAYLSTTEKSNQPLFMSINISGRQLHDTDFFDSLKTALSGNAIDAGDVKLEITETALAETDAAISWINQCKAIGVSVSLDDFGTGYSSLNYLNRFSIDCLKLDKTFLDEANKNTQSLIVLKSIIKMAADLRLPVIAEGIEDQKSVDILTSLSCHFGQGYFFGKPMRMEQAIDFIMRSKSNAA